MKPIYGKTTQTVNSEPGGFCACPAACLFVWPELCSLLTACRGSQGPAVCCLLGSTEETSICLSLKGRSVNMTWSNNYYTFWQLCNHACISVSFHCVCEGVFNWAFVLPFCATGGFLPVWLAACCETIPAVPFVGHVHVCVCVLCKVMHYIHQNSRCSLVDGEAPILLL